MLLTLIRFSLAPEFTDGLMLVDGQFFGYTVEDTVRPAGQKVPGKTAIPAGRYSLSVEKSEHFSQKAGTLVELPRLHDVPQFDGVLIHGGNSAADSEGCILVASHRVSPGHIQGSLSLALTQMLKGTTGSNAIEIFEVTHS